jgi:FtsZ-binding cell division protein ZapB
MSKEDRKIWLINEQGQKLFIYETEKCDMKKELNETIQRLQKRIEELEEENKELMKLKKDHSYSVDVVRQNTKLRYELFNSIPKAKVENLLKTKIIEYDCEDCITGKFIEVEDVEELLKDGGE